MDRGRQQLDCAGGRAPVASPTFVLWMMRFLMYQRNHRHIASHVMLAALCPPLR
jgi:hypothetical protein